MLIAMKAIKVDNYVVKVATPKKIQVSSFSSRILTTYNAAKLIQKKYIIDKKENSVNTGYNQNIISVFDSIFVHICTY